MERKKKQGPLKYINGIKGAISLFLAVLMTPFLSIAMMLVEVDRYNSAISIFDEAMGVSAVSTLANYDEYIHKRWGLLCLGQEEDADALYAEYLAVNSGVIGSEMEVESVSTEGLYPLSDTSILKNQVLEFGKLNSPTELATEFGDVTNAVKLLEEKANIGDIASIFGSGVDAIGSTITLVDSVEALKEHSENLEEYEDSYETSYNEFYDAVDALIAALGTARPDDEEYPDEAANYDQTIATLRGTVSTKKNAYYTVVDSIAYELQGY